MAAVTALGTTFDTNSGTKTVTATPAVGDLIVIITAHSDNVSLAPPTDDQDGTYGLVVSAAKNTSLDTLAVWVRNSYIASAVLTVFTHAPGASSGGGLCVLKATSMSRNGVNAAYKVALQSNQGAATPAPVFLSAVLTTNPVIGAVFNETNPATLTPRGAPVYTERADVGYITPTAGLEVMSIDSGETAATITWGSASGSPFCAVAVELNITVMATILGNMTNSAGFSTAHGRVA